MSAGNTEDTTPAPLIDWQQLTIAYGDTTVLHDVNFQWQHGQRIALLGKSGAGKSSLLKKIYTDLAKNTTAQAIGWVPQQLGLVDQLSSFHNVYMGQLDQHSAFYNLLNLIWPQRTHKTAIADLLQQLAIEQTLFSRVAQLSGGQQQRIAIARALYSKADIILADEPVSNLDTPMANTVINLLIQQSQSSVVALHNIELALAFATRIIGIKAGRIVIDLPSDQVSTEQLDQLYAN